MRGHKLTIEWNGEHGEERSSTGRCICGWSESHSTQAGVRDEYWWHLKGEPTATEHVMTATERVIKEIFGEPAPPLTPEQHEALTAMLSVQIDTLFRGEYYNGVQSKIRGERNRQIVRRVLLDRIPLKQAGIEFHLTPSRISQFRLKGLRMLRHPMRSKPLKDIFRKREETNEQSESD